MYNLIENGIKNNPEEYTDENMLEIDLEMILDELDDVSMALPMSDKPC